MWLQALLTPADLEHVLAQVTPVRIALDEDDPDGSYLWIDRPSQVELRSGEGLRIATSARVQWEVVGIKVPLTLRAVTLRLIPSIAQRDGKDVLAFCAQVEEADLSSVPGFIETPLIARVNEALAAEHAQLAWAFTDTLDFNFHLPPAMEPQRNLRLFARWGAVRTSGEAVAVAASFRLDAAHVEGSDAGRAVPSNGHGTA